jgi:dienelactone hydrolase
MAFGTVHRGSGSLESTEVSRLILLLVVLFLPWVGANSGNAQTSHDSVEQTLKQLPYSADLREFQLQEYLLQRIPPLPAPTTAEEWRSQEEQLRRHILDDVAFHGWPHAWIDSAPDFQQVGVIETGHGYRIRKLRYEIVPGFQSTALLYEPVTISASAPAILNVIGHQPEGIAVEYEQKRCIDFAKRGIVALDLGWMGFGELSHQENAHDYAAQLNLVGSNALGLFYLAMRRGLDYLETLPEVDKAKLGVTGLSGGGWQTVMLSALDPRVTVSVEVAGVGSRESNITHPLDTYEIEAEAPDLMESQDYPQLIAMRAPRPTLLIHNAMDDCCFRAPLVKPYLYDQVKPFFQLFGASNDLAWHTNRDPGTHNYQLDNREQAYRFFTAHFHLARSEGEIFSDDEVRTPQELAIGVAANNLTLVGLAKKLALQIRREPIPTDSVERSAWARTERERLKSVVRYTPASTVHALRLGNGRGLDFQSLYYRFDFSNGLGANGVWLREDAAPENAKATIVLDDKGYQDASDIVADHVDRGEQVLAVDLLFQGADFQDAPAWAMLTDSSGSRPLGLEAAQLVAVANWLRSSTGRPVQVETDGIRNQVIAMTAAAIEPEVFSLVSSQNGMKSLTYLLDKPVPFRSAPELFSLDFYRYFDLESLTALAAPGKVSTISFIPN